MANIGSIVLGRVLKMAYSFTAAFPPKLRENDGNIFEVPPANLERLVGQEATWSSVPSAAADGSIISKRFVIKRRLYWSLSQIPVHYSTDEEVNLKYVKGYSKTQKESMEKSIGGKVGGSFFGLTAEVVSALKLTTDFTEEWREETTVEVKVKYLKDHTYCSWRLNDSIEISIETSTALPGQPPVITLDSVQDRIVSVISIYNDSAADEDAHIVKNSTRNLSQNSYNAGQFK